MTLTHPDTITPTETVPTEALPEIGSTLEQAVAWLGSFESADDLAAWFKQHGVKGQPATPDKCPIANAISGATGQPVSVASVTTDWTDHFETPLVARNFMGNFDTGFYPELVA